MNAHRRYGPDQVARAEMAERVEEAFDTLRRLPDSDRARLGMQTLQWPLVLRRMWDDAMPSGMRVRLPPPNMRQIDRMYEVLDWMLALARRGHPECDFAKTVYYCCGRRLEIATVARLMGCHRETARVWRNNGLDRMAVLKAQSEAA